MTLVARAWRPALVILLVLAVWELYVDLGGADPLILPAPHAVAAATWRDRSLLWSNFVVSAEEIVLGIGLATATGFGFAVSLHLSERTLRPAVMPLLIASQTVPIALLAPVLVFWLGFGLVPKLVVIAVVSFFSIVLTTLAGLSGVDPDLRKLMRTLGADRAQILRHVELPAALPGLFTGVKIAVVVAPIAAVLAEQAGSGAGLGYVFQQALVNLLTARMCAAVAILSLFAVALFVLLSLLERWALPWAPDTRGSLATP